MERDYSVIQVIQNEFPALVYRQPYCVEGFPRMLKAVQTFAEYTRAQLLERNETEIEHCFHVAKGILTYGSNLAKLAIENIFVYNVSRLLEVSLSVSQSERNLFLKFFRKEYEALILVGHA